MILQPYTVRILREKHENVVRRGKVVGEFVERENAFTIGEQHMKLLVVRKAAWRRGLRAWVSRTFPAIQDGGMGARFAKPGRVEDARARPLCPGSDIKGCRESRW